MARKNKLKTFGSPLVGQTMLQTEDAQKISQTLSEPETLTQDPGAPKIPGYILLKPIGQGAYAQVWEALQVRTRKRVAVKVFIKKSGVHWFFLQREAERLIRLDKHPHIVSLLDADLNGEVPYYVMDLAQEGSLERHIAHGESAGTNPLGIEKAAEWMKEIAQALQYVHAKQMVHCDLKPANVLLDEEGYVRVADFGHSRVLSESGGALGTLYYMAPEQAVIPSEEQPPQPDVRWDIYALGCTLYVLLSGHVPHEEIGPRLETTPKLQERLRIYREAIASDPVPSLFESTQGRVDIDLSAIIAKCMRTRPEERYDSVTQVLEDLKARHRGKPVSPLAGNKPYRFRKFARRHRIPLAAIALAAFSLLASFFLLSRNKNLQAQGTTLNYVLKGREFLLKDDPASAVAYFAASNKVSPSILARGNAVLHMPPIPSSLLRLNGKSPLVSLSPDAKVLLISNGNEARFWDMTVGRPLGDTFRAPNDLTAAAFNRDGSTVLLGDSKGVVRLMEVATRKTLGKPMRHDKGIISTAFAPFEKRVLTSSLDGTARLWDMEKSQPRGDAIQLEIKGAPAWYRPDVAYSPDGKTILASGWNGTVRFYNDNGGKKDGTLRLKGTGAKAVFSPDGGSILTSVLGDGSIGSCRSWSVQGHHPGKFNLKASGGFSAMAFSPDGRRIATAGAENVLRIWDAVTGASSGQFSHDDLVTLAFFSPSGDRLFTASRDGYLRAWDLNEDADPLQLAWKDAGAQWLKKGQIHAVFGPGGRNILTYGGTSAVLWDAASGKPLYHPFRLSDKVLRVVFSPKNSHLLTLNKDRNPQLWDLGTGKPRTLPKTGPIQGAVFSADGTTALTGGADNVLRLWDVRTGKEKGPPLILETHIRRPLLSPDGKKMGAIGADGWLRLYPAGKKDAPPLVQVKSARNAVFSPDGSLLLSIAGPNASLWDLTTMKEARVFKHGSTIGSALFGPDGTTLATFGMNGTARLWTTAIGAPVGNLLKHPGGVMDAMFSPGGEVLFVAYRNGGWQLWDVQTGEPIGEELFPAQPLWALAFAPDGRSLRVLDRKGSLSSFDTSWIDPHSDPDRLLLMSQVAGACRVGPQGSLETLSVEEWARLWRKFRKAGIP